MFDLKLCGDDHCRIHLFGSAGAFCTDNTSGDDGNMMMHYLLCWTPGGENTMDLVNWNVVSLTLFLLQAVAMIMGIATDLTEPIDSRHYGWYFGMLLLAGVETVILWCVME